MAGAVTLPKTRQWRDGAPVSNRPRPKNQAKPHVTAANTDRVVVAYIHAGQTSSYFTQSLVNLLMFDQAPDRRIVGCHNEWSSANISAARNSLTAQFVDDHDADWLLWIDADMAFEHVALPQLLASADPAERPIVGGLCFGSSLGVLFPTIYQFTKNEAGDVTTLRVNDYPDNQLVQCAATGAAFLLIHRTVLVAMRDRGFNAAFPWFQETELSGQPAGEDLTFCIRAGICGYPIHVDTTVKVGHHKSTVLDHDTFQAQKAGEP
jgi:hypothetical protein